MANNKHPNIDPEIRYTAREASPMLNITEATLKKKCRSGEIEGIQVGPRKIWMIEGAQIITVRERWKLV